MNQCNRVFSLLCTVLCLLSFAPAAPAQLPAVEVDVFERTVWEMDLVIPQGGSEAVKLVGSVTETVTFDGEIEGSAVDDDRDGLDDVGAQLTGMDIGGFSPTFGPVRVSLNPQIPALGIIEETANNTPGTLDVPPFTKTGTADSFFDVFVEIDIGGQKLHNEAPIRIRGGLTHKPPAFGDGYTGLEPVELYDQNANPTGFMLGVTVFRPNPVVEVDVFPGSLLSLDLLLPDASIENVWLTGQSGWSVYFEGATEGTANDDDGDGRDDARTVMTQMDFHGLSPTLGPVLVGLDTGLPSEGVMEEQANNTPGVLDVPPFSPTGAADSFFDVFVEIDIGSQTLHNETPLRLGGAITHKPPAPGDDYSGAAPVELFDQLGNPTGFHFRISRYRPNPVVEVDAYENSLLSFNLVAPDAGSEALSLTGQSGMNVYFEGAVEGSAADDDGDGREDVGALMTRFDFSGSSPTLGVVSVMLRPTVPSTGILEETVNNTPNVLDIPPFTPTGTADSFFDVFVEISVGGEVLHTAEPLRLSGRISHKPAAPGNELAGLEPVELFNRQGEPTGFLIGGASYRPTAMVEVDTFPGAMMELVLNMSGGSPAPVRLWGNAVEHVFFEGTTEGSARDDDGDGLEDVDTELVELDLVRAGSALGGVRVTVSPARPSTGMIEERVNNTAGVLDLPPFAAVGSANSFFDVFLEIEVDGQRLHTEVPVRLAGRLTHKPAGAGDVYLALPDADLFDEANNPAGITISAIRYWPIPVVEVDAFPVSRWHLDFITQTGTESVVLTGSSVMRVYFEGATEGSAFDAEGDGLDDVDTLLAELVLSGTGETLGPVTVTLNADLPSVGVIEERINNTNGILDVPPFTPYGTADSYFDVFLNVEMGGETFHNVDLIRLSTVIGHKPPGPGTVYTGLPYAFLVDASGGRTDYLLAIRGYEPVQPPTGCGDGLHPYPIGDLNHDCIVNELDLIILQWHWMECTQPECE